MSDAGDNVEVEVAEVAEVAEAPKGKLSRQCCCTGHVLRLGRRTTKRDQGCGEEPRA